VCPQNPLHIYTVNDACGFLYNRRKKSQSIFENSERTVRNVGFRTAENSLTECAVRFQEPQRTFFEFSSFVPWEYKPLSCKSRHFTTGRFLYRTYITKRLVLIRTFYLAIVKNSKNRCSTLLYSKWVECWKLT
jgi:hypothetical protein